MFLALLGCPWKAKRSWRSWGCRWERYKWPERCHRSGNQDFILKDILLFPLSAPISLFSALETREEAASGWAFPLPGNSHVLGGKDEENSLLWSTEQLERRKKPSLGCRQKQEQREVGEEPLLLHSWARQGERALLNSHGFKSLHLYPN